MGSSTISLQKAIAASKDNPDLRDVLLQIQAGAQEQKAVTGTTPVAGTTAGQVNPSASVPPQAIASVSILGAAYVVQITNPGAQNKISALQSAQAAAGATSLTPLQPVTPIYHQIRASTSPAFNVNSNTQTFGGNTGSTQVYWTITGLGSGTWYFQFRSSYDGVNFNSWKNANSGNALGGLVNQVTEENIGNANWALFTMPGKMTMGIGEGFCADGEIFNLASQVFSSGMFAIAGPNGFTRDGDSTYGTINCDVDVIQPTSPVAGVPDLPVQIAMRYGQWTEAPKYWAGTATVFAIAFDPTNENVKFYTTGTGTWAEMRLPGGAKIAFGMGKNFDGDVLTAPPELSWFDWSRTISICSLTAAVDTGSFPHGYYKNDINAGTLEAQYNDEGHSWSTTANWLVIAWQSGASVQMVGGAPWLTISLQGGHEVVIGGSTATIGTAVTLPTGFTQDQMLSICTPANFEPSGHHLQGVLNCAFNGLIPVLQYRDNSLNTWSGDTHWLIAAWK